MLLVIRIT